MYLKPKPSFLFPAFDHGKGDPEPDTHIFDRHQHKVVLCEGLYLLHDQDGWEDIASVFDLTIFVSYFLGVLDVINAAFYNNVLSFVTSDERRCGCLH